MAADARSPAAGVAVGDEGVVVGVAPEAPGHRRGEDEEDEEGEESGDRRAGAGHPGSLAPLPGRPFSGTASGHDPQDAPQAAVEARPRLVAEPEIAGGCTRAARAVARAGVEAGGGA